MKENELGIRFRGSALTYAILISLILTLITLSLVSAMQLHQHRLAGITAMHQVVRDVDSGLELMLADPSMGKEKLARIDLFQDGRDSVYLKRKPWGAFEVVSVRAKCGNQTETRRFLVGTLLSTESPVLTLVDHGKPLSLCGETNIQGDCKLPKAGVKRAYIEGKNYVGKELIYGHQSVSKASFPNMEVTAFQELVDAETEVIEFDAVSGRSLRRSFSKPSLLVKSIDRIDLFGMDIEGNVLIRSENEIHIGASTNLSRCVLSAPKVTVERGFVGDAQIYGDTVIMGTEVLMEYPSCIFSNGGLIQVRNGSSVAGAIGMSNNMGEAILEIEAEASVYGLVHIKGSTQLKGSVFGELLTERFVLKTASATYENHLLDATIAQEGLPRPFAGPVGLGTQVQLATLQ